MFFLCCFQIETVFGSPNMTVAYHVTGGDIVYPPSVVLNGLNAYGRDKLIADLRQYLPMVTALPQPVALWRSSPAPSLQLKTGQQYETDALCFCCVNFSFNLEVYFTVNSSYRENDSE